MPTFRVTNEFGHESFYVAPSAVEAAVKAKDFPGEHKNISKVSEHDQQELFREEGFDPTFRYGAP
jgi:hypothetical protein